MITLQDLSEFLNQLLSPAHFSDYCPNGLQVEGKGEIRRVLCAVSASCEAIEAAIQQGADALIVHHGIFWEKDPLPITGIKKAKIERLLNCGISLFAYHLPLDAHVDVGNNWKAASELGWQDLQPFGRMGKVELGVQGTFSPCSIGEFQKMLETYYRHPAHAALGGPKEVRSAALVSGGAHRLIQEAADKGVDCFITGSFDEPIWDIAKERKIHFFALGHYATERIGVKTLAAWIKEKCGIDSSFIDFNNPF